jgi:hypothetical protein
LIQVQPFTSRGRTASLAGSAGSVLGSKERAIGNPDSDERQRRPSKISNAAGLGHY